MMVTVNRVAGYRKMLNLTQADIAKKLGISAQAYGQKENGKVAFKDQEKIIMVNILKIANPDLNIQNLFF